MTLTNEEALKQSDELYEQYGKPFEAEHWGQFIAISPDGRILLGSDMAEVLDDALSQFGGGVHVFKVGPIATGRFR